MSANEAIIRDKLSNNLDIIEEGLVLLQVEQYLPNENGSRGFIDIFAKDGNNKFVIIELKKADATCRQAAHEILKYIEGIKENFALKDSEFRVFVISTHWKELLVPLSSLANRINFSITGLNLKISEDGTPVEATKVEFLPLSEERLFTPWHEVSMYESLEKMKKGLVSYQRVCKEKCINDFVLVMLSANDEAQAWQQRKAYEASKAMITQMGIEFMSEEEYFSKHKSMPFMLYFAMLKIDDDVVFERISKKLGLKNKEEFEEFTEYLGEMEGEDKTNVLHNKLLEIKPWPLRDYLEISYPAKFTRIIDVEHWEVLEIKRFGKIEKNILLDNETIIGEIRGEQGVTRQRYVKELRGYDATEISNVRSEIKKCLEDNPVWAHQLDRIIKDISDMAAAAPTNISILNPGNIILAIYQLIAREDGMLYFPGYRIHSESDDRTELIYGELTPSGGKPSMKKIISEYYNGEFFELLEPLSWGGYEIRDTQIVRDIGLKYETYKIIMDSHGKKFFKLTDLGWELCKPRSFMEGINSYIENNGEFIDDVCGFFSKYWNGFAVTWIKGINDDAFEFQT